MIFLRICKVVLDTPSVSLRALELTFDNGLLIFALRFTAGTRTDIIDK